MAFPASRVGRVGQSQYWTYFVVNLALVPMLLFGGLYFFVTGKFGAAFLAFLIIIPVGLYFRVIMMRRCRDIGWPAALPWIIFGFQGMMVFVVMASGTGGHAPSLRPSPSALALPLVGSVDFILSIVIGCIASKEPENLASIFGSDDPAAPAYRPVPAHRLDSAPASYGQQPTPRQQPDRQNGLSLDESLTREAEVARQDEAIARALAAYRDNQSGEDVRSGAVPHSVHRPPRSAGFGRKGL